jgi:putative membrane protein
LLPAPRALGGGAVRHWGRATRRIFSTRTRGGIVDLGPERDEAPPQTDVVVCASGNLALIYLTYRRHRLTLEEISSRHADLVPGLAAHPGIAFVVVLSAQRGPLAVAGDGVCELATGAVTGADPLADFELHARAHLRRLSGFAHIGDLVVNSRFEAESGEVAPFEELIGSHGGLGGEQSDAFLLLPSEWSGSAGELVGARAVHRFLAQRIHETQGTAPRGDQAGQSHGSEMGGEPDGGGAAHGAPSRG